MGLLISNKDGRTCAVLYTGREGHSLIENAPMPDIPFNPPPPGRGESTVHWVVRLAWRRPDMNGAVLEVPDNDSGEWFTVYMLVMMYFHIAENEWTGELGERPNAARLVDLVKQAPDKTKYVIPTQWQPPDTSEDPMKIERVFHRRFITTAGTLEEIHQYIPPGLIRYSPQMYKYAVELWHAPPAGTSNAQAN